MLRAVGDLVFPPYCILCRRFVEAVNRGVCAACAAELAAEVARPACPTCGRTVGTFGVSEDRCRACASERHHFSGLVRVAEYRERFAALTRAYKYQGRTQLEPLLAGSVVEVVQRTPWFRRMEAVVSVPTHWRHRLGRPLYPADVLADRVSKATGLPRVRVLRRVRAGPHQIGLSFTDRQANVRGAFALRRGVTMNDARLLLIDDVKTTGATLNECAKILRAGGAAEVFAAVVVTVGTDVATSHDLPLI